MTFIYTILPMGLPGRTTNGHSSWVHQLQELVFEAGVEVDQKMFGGTCPVDPSLQKCPTKFFRLLCSAKGPPPAKLMPKRLSRPDGSWTGQCRSQ